MDDKLLGDMIKAELDREILSNSDLISSRFLSCDPNITDRTAALLAAAISISAQLSAQYVIRFLENNGLLALPEDGQPLLQLLTDESLPPDPS